MRKAEIEERLKAIVEARAKKDGNARDLVLSLDRGPGGQGRPGPTGPSRRQLLPLLLEEQASAARLRRGPPPGAGGAPRRSR